MGVVYASMRDMDKKLKAFRLGDVRGLYPEDVNADFALAFGHGIAHYFQLTGTIAVGHDARDSSPVLHQQLIEGLLASGVNVVDLGLCATELGYFASSLPAIDAAVVVTASHNPPAFNGFKLVLSNGQPVTFASGLQQVMTLMLSNHRNSARRGTLIEQDVQGAYLHFLNARFKSMPTGNGLIALNGLNGTAATLAHDLASHFMLPVHWFRRQPGPLPAEGADPSKPRLQAEMHQFMQQQTFSMGVAWDGDCDRCVFFDGAGELVPTYFVIGLLAQHYLQTRPGAAIVFDTKLCWHTLDVIRGNRGRAVRSETGHAFMKQHMRANQAAYGGELSSHHYFGDFFACDSGMIAWLKVIEILNQQGQSLGEVVSGIRQKICCTPEINLQLNDVERAFALIQARYAQGAKAVDHFDGVSFEMPGDWRFSLSISKTEALVRLNLESRGNPERLLTEGNNLLRHLSAFQADDTVWQDSLFIQ